MLDPAGCDDGAEGEEVKKMEADIIIIIIITVLVLSHHLPLVGVSSDSVLKHNDSDSCTTCV